MNKHVKRVSNVDSSLKLNNKTSIFLLVFEEEVDLNMGRTDLLRDNNDVLFLNLIFFLSFNLSNSYTLNLVRERILFIWHYLCEEDLPWLDQSVQHLVWCVFPKEGSKVSTEKVVDRVIVLLKVKLNWVSFEWNKVDFWVSFCEHKLFIIGHYQRSWISGGKQICELTREEIVWLDNELWVISCVLIVHDASRRDCRWTWSCIHSDLICDLHDLSVEI